MNCRERVLRTITFDYPDRIPFSYSVLPLSLIRYGQRLIDICRKYPNDFYDPDIVKGPERDTAHYRPDGSYYKEETDAWGSVRVFMNEGLFGEIKQPVLDDWSKLKSFKIPTVPNSSPADRRRMKEEVKKQKEKYVGWGATDTLFEQMQFLRGTENLLIDIAEDREEVYILADMLLERRLILMAELALESGVDIVGLGDDWGAQNRMLINPDTWRKIFKPRYKRLFDLIHQGNAFPWLHSDGAQTEILPDWIEIGLSVLNPSLSSMDLQTLHKATEGRLCISGEVDSQWTLASGTPEQVDKYIRRVARVFGSPKGGFIYHVSLIDVSLGNVEATFKSIYEVRRLPGSS